VKFKKKRYWLTRAIEGYLRGKTYYADQMFLLRRGLVENTVENILKITVSGAAEVFQCCFDMLGELIKFNTFGYEILNLQLQDDEKVSCCC
jgi:Trpc4-associated protein